MTCRAGLKANAFCSKSNSGSWEEDIYFAPAAMCDLGVFFEFLVKFLTLESVRTNFMQFFVYYNVGLYRGRVWLCVVAKGKCEGNVGFLRQNL